MKALGTLALALMPVTAVAATSALNGPGNWVRLFNRDMEILIGRTIHVDAASVKAGGLGRTFREIDVLVKARGRLPRGTTQYMLRSIDCGTGRVRLEQWQLFAPDGSSLGGSTAPGAAQRVRWNKEDGMVIRYVCQGILPR
ncbi:hypothetical protein AB3M93_03420 [Novosphingobium panipatense]|uniref:hypothetical protein n=1 Tax=Novosphingobium TaxID=165696 RepID=UPI001E2C955C|nr:hypothetical protein [Novosphingobium sp. HII-3]